MGNFIVAGGRLVIAVAETVVLKIQTKLLYWRMCLLARLITKSMLSETDLERLIFKWGQR